MATPYDLDLDKGIWPLFIRMGSLLSRLIPLRAERRVFFFFPYCHVGGAEIVHADIVGCMATAVSSVVFFTHRSSNKKMLPQFRRNATCFGGWVAFKYLLPLSVGLMSGIINRNPSCTVFGCNSRFFYKLLPFLDETVKKVDLVHAFGGGSEDYSLEAVPHIDRRVVINRRTYDDFSQQYARCNVDRRYLERIVLIQNSVPVPAECPAKDRSERVRVLYVGRGTEEKRVHLVGKAAALCAEAGLPVDFTLVGDVANSISETDRTWCSLAGEVSDRRMMEELYASADVLVLTSSREGFPMVIMEAMAYGVVPVTTAVGGIPEHVVDGENGILLREDEMGLPEEIQAALGMLLEKRAVLDSLSKSAYLYARNNFNHAVFCQKYRELLGC